VKNSLRAQIIRQVEDRLKCHCI